MVYSNCSRKSGRLAGSSDSPAAMAWPPKRIRVPLQRSSSSTKLIPRTLREEPTQAPLACPADQAPPERYAQARAGSASAVAKAMADKTPRRVAEARGAISLRQDYARQAQGEQSDGKTGWWGQYA